MEMASRVVELANRAANNNTVVNVFLLGLFGALCARSVSQQRNIEALEVEKESLIKSNKAMKKTMWDWKQQLFAEATTDYAVVPLDPTNVKEETGTSPASRFVI
ncbi:hypothetical protein RJ641_029405 [Dillenia turbinata]|uniref:Uncharacterized protein n=1 Tax=Dillenia turbinata TaxID=194707 RepID=A0AAN8VY64_9MAGN